MIKSIKIRNIAIIDHLDLELRAGFTTITGQTGAGKSILFDAIGLALGDRANSELIRQGQSKASVELVISLPLKHQQRVDRILDDADCGLCLLMEEEPQQWELVLKRVLTSTGRNRVYVNGTATSIGVLTAVTTGLIDVIGQHAAHKLLSPSEHLPLLDRYAHTHEMARQVRMQVQQLRELRRESQQLRAAEAERAQELKRLTTDLEEIEMAHLSVGEDQLLDQQLELMLNAEQLRETTLMLTYLLRENEHSVCDNLSEAIRQLSAISHLSPELSSANQVLERCSLELVEVARDISSYSETAGASIASSAELESLQQRIELIDRLKRRHSPSGEQPSIFFVLQAVDTLQRRCDQLMAMDTRASVAETQAEQLESALMESAVALAYRRQEAAKRLALQVERELRELGMPECQFQVSQCWYNGQRSRVTVPTEACASQLTEQGLDVVEFQIAPNPGEGLKSLARIASGGELSRILLALKSTLISSDPALGYIFDEVDTGIGGGVAETIGRKLQRIGDSRQALCITHLAQVACCAHHHLWVEKAVHNETARTTSSMRYLTHHQRIDEVARMLGGIELTSRTQAHAEEMLRSSARSSTDRESDVESTVQQGKSHLSLVSSAPDSRTA